MISAFTISFDFEGKTYLGFASIKQEKDNESSCVVSVYDKVLCRIIHGDRIKYSGGEAEDHSQFQHPLADKLFHCINDSVSAHLESARSIKYKKNL